MVTKRSLLLAIVLPALFLEQAFALPLQTIVSLRAGVCCAVKCRHAGSLDRTARCCHSHSIAQDPVTFSKRTLRTPEAQTSSFHHHEDVAAPRETGLSFDPIHEVFARPAPIFLLDKSLLL
jgi:hypothetical protein